jgi:hypothetical protein
LTELLPLTSSGQGLRRPEFPRQGNFRLESVLAIFGVKPGVLTMKGIGTLIIKIENQNDNFPSIILREISAQIRFRQGTD